MVNYRKNQLGQTLCNRAHVLGVFIYMYGSWNKRLNEHIHWNIILFGKIKKNSFDLLEGGIQAVSDKKIQDVLKPNSTFVLDIYLLEDMKWAKSWILIEFAFNCVELLFHCDFSFKVFVEDLRVFRFEAHPKVNIYY